MNRIIRFVVLPICILTLMACNIGNPTSTPNVLAIAAVSLNVQVQNATDTFNTVGQKINYNFKVTNTGTLPLTGSVTVTGDKASGTCPSLNDIGDKNGRFDPTEWVDCPGSYAITQADLNAGSVTNNVTASVPGANPVQANAVVNMTVNNVLTLTRSADTTTYNQVGQIINFSYSIQNTGSTTLGPVQFVVNDDHISGPINCGEVRTLAPSESVPCTAKYSITQADLDAGSVTSNATATGGSANVIQPVSLKLSKAQSNFVPGSTIQHTVVKGEWLMQIARCYGADYQAVRRANWQIYNPNLISPNSIVTVPNIGSNGTIYGPRDCVVFHTVQASDTWESIAQTYNADVIILKAANRGVILSAGKVIKVPRNSAGGTTQPPPPGNKTLTVTKSGTGSGTVTSSPAGINCGSTCAYAFADNTVVTLTANPASPSTFGGWSGAGCSGTALTCTVTMNAAQTVTATFTTTTSNQTLTVTKGGTGTGTVTSSPAGIDCGATCAFAFPINTTVTLTATPTSPSTFGGWGGAGCSGISPTCTVTMNQAQAVTATFNPPDSQIMVLNKAGTGSGTVTSSPAGIDCGTTCSSYFPFNTMVTLTASPISPSTFGGWSGGGCSGTSPTCTVTMNQVQTVTASFNTSGPSSLTVTKGGTGTGTVTSSPTGIDCGTTCTFAFPFNTTVTLTASPISPSTFGGWGGACSGTSPTCTVTINQAQTVTATFNAPGNQTLTVTRTGLLLGTVTSSPAGINCGTTCSFDFPFNTTVTLTANPTFAFGGWSGACSGNSLTCTITMNQPQTVNASFTP